MNRLSILIFLLCWLAYPGLSQSSSIVLEDATLIHPDRGITQAHMSILIDLERIVKIARTGRLRIPADATRISMKGKFIMPGLVDAHVHYFQSGGLYTRPDAIDLRAIRPYEQERQWLLTHASDLMSRYIKAGITTTIDVGGPMSNFDIRNLASESEMAPRILVTGPLISTYVPAELDVNDPPIILARTPEEAREMVRKQLPFQPDLIKIWYIVFRRQSPKDNLPIVKAAIEESHAHGLRVAVHATQLETARLAVQAGADILVHSVDDKSVDEAFVELLVKNEVSYIPTLIVGGNYERIFSQQFSLSRADLDLAEPHTVGSLQDLQHLPESIIPGYVRRMMSAPPPNTADEDSIMAQNLRKIMQAGVKVATGTDAGNIGTLHASSYYAEITAMRRAGLTPVEILQASTVNGAAILGKENEFGRIANGAVADLLILDKNPLLDLDHLQQVHAVIKNGKLFSSDLLLDSPAQIAQRQLNAYNAHDIDAFVSYYHPEVEVYQFPNTLQYKGREKMHPRYAAFFERNPRLHCELKSRIVLGNQVIDREHILGLTSGDTFEAVAIYEIENGLIRRVYFMRE